jgi:hypothetical protein
MTLKIQLLAWERHTNVEGLNMLMVFNPSLLFDNWISNSNAYIQMIKKITCTDPFPLKKTT